MVRCSRYCQNGPLHSKEGVALADTSCYAGIVGLQAAVDGGAAAVSGVQLLDVSLRMLHVRKQAPWQRPLVAALQRILRDTPLGTWFFSSVAKPAVGGCLQRSH